MVQSNDSEDALTRLLAQGGDPGPEDALNQALQPKPTHSPGGGGAGKAAHDERLAESKGALKREAQAQAERIEVLEGVLQRGTALNFGLMVVAGLALALAAGMWVWTRAGTARAMEQAFRIIAYRENRALSANAIVLDEWAKRMDALITKVGQDPNLAPEEREKRLRTLAALKKESEVLRGGFLRQLSENEKESAVTGGFSYRDPFLKREVNLAETMGGRIDLDALKDEVRKNANLDATLKSLEATMVNPIPLEEQVRQQAVQERRDGTLQSVDVSQGVDLSKGFPTAGPGAPLKIPTGPNPNTSRVEVQ